MLSVLILSKNAANLTRCLDAIRKNQPSLLDNRIYVVDDGIGDRSHFPVRWIEGAKPFIYARNVNAGISTIPDGDVLLLNDDAELDTPNGFDLLDKAAAEHGAGICSPVILGRVGNQNQRPKSQGETYWPESTMLCFVAVLLRREVLEAVGPLDERFTGYGWDDNDYCRRALSGGFQLGVYGGTVVRHESAHATYRGQSDFGELATRNQKLYRDKWGMDVR